MIKVLFAGRTYSVSNKEPIDYGIVYKPDSVRFEVITLYYIPDLDKVTRCFPNIEKKMWRYYPWEVLTSLIILRVTPRMTQNPAIVRGENVRVEKLIPAESLAKKVLGKAEEVAKKLEEGIPLTDEDVGVEVDSLQIEVNSGGGYSTEAEIEEALQGLYIRIGGARKRVLVFVASPALVEINNSWYLVALPKVLGAIRSTPQKLVATSIIKGFNAPLLVVKDLQPKDLGTPDEHVENVDWLHSRLTMAELRMFRKIFAGVSSESESPI